MTPRLRVRSGRKSTPGGVEILRDVDLEVEAGEFVAVVGRSGTGKSTLLAVLGLLDTFDGGRYELEGVEVKTLSRRRADATRGTRIGFVFQNFSLVPHLTALQNVYVPWMHARGRSRRTEAERIRRLFEALEIGGLEDRLPRRLSGGEQQRVAIARALASDPAVILADEPTGSLDVETGHSVMHLLRQGCAESGAALLVVTHDPEIAGAADHGLRLVDGRLESLRDSP